MIKEIQVKGQKILLHRRKGMKNFYIKAQIPSGKVLILAPYGLSQSFIENLLLENWTKVKDLQKEAIKNGKDLTPSFDSGSKIFLWGQPYSLEIQKGLKSQVYICGQKIVLESKKVEGKEKKEKLLEEFYRQELKTALKSMVPLYEEKMGLELKEWRCKKMRTRWGSCNIYAKRIWLSLSLAQYPKECLEAVLVHEMIHLWEKNHTKNFYQLLNKYYPKWKEMDALLKKGLNCSSPLNPATD